MANGGSVIVRISQAGGQAHVVEMPLNGVRTAALKLELLALFAETGYTGRVISGIARVGDGTKQALFPDEVVRRASAELELLALAAPEDAKHELSAVTEVIAALMAPLVRSNETGAADQVLSGPQKDI